ncbi:MAG: nucleotidyltransferase domain-containing protein [Nitriliruptor sp.]
MTPTLDGDVLCVLAGADATFTGRQVARLLPSHSQKGIHNVLRRLTEQGIVTMAVAGPAHLYSLNRDHLAAPYIVGLCQVKDQLRHRVTELVQRWPVPAEAVILFGSAARGEMRPTSDIDLFVVRPDAVDEDVWRDQAAELAERVSAWTGNDARAVEMTPEEVRDGLHEDDGLLRSVRDEGQALFGDPRYLYRIGRVRKGVRG